MSPRRVVRQMRPTLDTFNFWVGIAYFGLAALVVALYFVNQSTQRSVTRQAQDEAAHSAEIVANANGRYQQCVGSIPTLSKFNAFIEGTQEGWHILITNSRTNLAISPNPAVYKQRAANLARIVKASRKIDQPKKFPIPTQAKCRELRSSLLHQR